MKSNSFFREKAFDTNRAIKGELKCPRCGSNLTVLKGSILICANQLKCDFYKVIKKKNK
jgi:transposase-like protein